MEVCPPPIIAGKQENSVANKRILLLSVVPPNTRYTGGLMLHSMCQSLKADNLSCFSVLNPRMKVEMHPELEGIPYKAVLRPREAQTRHLPRRLGSLECYFKETYTASVTVPQLAEQVRQFIKETKPELIFCTLEGQTMIRLADQIQKTVPLPMVTQVWDPPQWWMRSNSVDGWSVNGVLKTFSSVLKNSQAVAAASWSMAETYNREHGCKAIPVVPGLPQTWAKQPATRLNDSNKLVIGFAGQMYSKDEWNALLETLDALDWKVEGRDVEIKMLGREFELEGFNKRNIQYLGWRDQLESIEILSQCDILYCPYFFDRQLESTARLSFPSKLTTYLASGRPVLLHGPEYSSPFKFLKEHDAGMLCHGLAKSAISNALSRLVRDTDRYAQVAQNGHKAFAQNLTDEHMRAQFLKTLAMAESRGPSK
jgi:glycosyltransferase involved in cell wall biosynthesis